MCRFEAVLIWFRGRELNQIDGRDLVHLVQEGVNQIKPMILQALTLIRFIWFIRFIRFADSIRFSGPHI